MVNETWDPSSGQGGWNLRFHRDFNDWELDLIRGLPNMLKDFRISSEEDVVLWKGGGHGKYGVKVAYNVLAVTNACTFPTKCLKGKKRKGKAICWGFQMKTQARKRIGFKF